MRDYLIEGGFVEKKLNNCKKCTYLLFKMNDNHFVIYLDTKSIKKFVKKFFNIDMKIYPNEIFIIYNNGEYIIKMIDNISKKSKLKQIPFLKKNYEMMFNTVNCKLSYGVCINNDNIDSDLKSLDVIKAYNTEVFHKNVDYSNLDSWLDDY